MAPPETPRQTPLIALEEEFRTRLEKDLQIGIPKGTTMRPDAIEELGEMHDQWLTLGGDSVMLFEFSPVWRRQELGAALPTPPPPQRPKVSAEQMREIFVLRARMIALIADPQASLILDAIPEADRKAFEKDWDGVTAVHGEATGATPEEPFTLDKRKLQTLDLFKKNADLALKDERIRGTKTEHSMRKAVQTVDLIKSIDPLRAKEWDVMRRRAEGGGILDKPLRLAVGGIATVLFIMALIPTIRKMVQGQNVTATDLAFTAAYAAAAAVALGIWPKGRQMELEQYALDTSRFMHPSYRPFWTLVNNTIGKDLAIAAVRELHDKLHGNAGLQNDLERALSMREVTTFVKDKFGEKSPVTAAIENCPNENQRILFLITLRSANLDTESGRNTLIGLLERTETFLR